MDLKEQDFNHYHDEIKFLTKSEIRLKILGCLYNSSASIKEIEEKTNYGYSSILDNINKLEQRGVIYSINDKFYLYNKTKIKIINMLNFSKSMVFLRENSSFLNDSLLDINIDTIKDLSALEDAKLVKSNNVDLFKIINVFKSSLTGFKFLRGIFPFFHPKHEDIISYWIDNPCTVELILPDEVTEAVKDFIKRSVPKSKEVKNEYVRVIPNDINVQFAFTVSDKCLVLAFYHKSGGFNQSAVITSTSKEAITWGLKLYDEYKELCGDYISLEDLIYPKDKGA